MSYIVLARQYRPKNFSEMVGQDHVVRALSNALQTQRLHHAYLFTGTRGVGKTTISRILAKSLNCLGADGQGGITDQPCGVCQACKDIDAGRFVDYIELDAASNRGVDEISQLLEQAVYKPVVGRFKVFMIDEVHMLSNTAFNAMLKTLEEPPEYLKFVLATTDPQKVPVTVLSRCLQFNLRPMAPETILEHLKDVLGQEKVTFDLGSLRLVSRAARGSMRDALSLLDQAIGYGNGNIEEAAIRQMLGSVGQAHIYQLIEAIASSNGKAVVESVDEMRVQGLSAEAALEEMTNVLQRMAILRVVPDAATEDDQEDEQILKLIPLMNPDEVQLLYSIVLHGQSELGLASDEYAALVMILLRTLAFKPFGQKLEGSEGEPATAIKTVAASEAEKKTEIIPPQSVKQPIAPATERRAEATTNNSLAPLPKPIAQEQESEQHASAKDNISSMSDPALTPIKEEEPPSEVEVAADVNSLGNSEVHKNFGATPPNQQAPTQTDDLPPWESDDSSDYEVGSQPSYTQKDEQQEEVPSYEDSPTFNQSSSVATNLPAQNEGKGARQSKTRLSDATPEATRWEEVAIALDEQGLVIALARELVLNVQVESISGDEKSWAFSCAMQTLISEANQQKMVAGMEELLGAPLQVVFKFGEVTRTLALRLQAEQEQRQIAAESAVDNDPDVQKWMSDFPGARIIPNSTKPL